MTPASAIRLEAPALRVTLDVIERQVAEGAGSDVAARWTADAARALGDGRDKLSVLRELADRVRRTVTFAPDEYGTENVQSLEETLENRRAGDCDDLTVAMLALGRRAGARGAAVVFHAGENETPIHVLAAFEDPADASRLIPVELARDVGFGQWPTMGRSGRWVPHWMQPPLEAGLGFPFAELGLGLANVGASIFGAVKGADAQREHDKAQAGAADRAQRSAEVRDAIARDSTHDAEVAATARLERSLEFGREAMKTLLVVGLALAGAHALVALSGGSRRRAA